MISIYDTRKTLQLISERLTRNPKAMFTRFGDNDIFQMDGFDVNHKALDIGRGMGGNRTKFSKYLQNEMIEAFQIPDKEDTLSYMIGVSGTYRKEAGMVKGVFLPFPNKRDLENRIRKFTRKKEFFNPIAFHYCCVFKNDVFERFVQGHIRGRKILYIGNVEREYVAKVLGPIDYHVSTPQFDAYSEIDDWFKKVEWHLDNEAIDVVIPSCGQASRIVTKRLWKQNRQIHSIDMGSLFDAVADVPSRTWIKEVGPIVRKYYR